MKIFTHETMGPHLTSVCTMWKLFTFTCQTLFLGPLSSAPFCQISRALAQARYWVLRPTRIAGRTAQRLGWTSPVTSRWHATWLPQKKNALEYFINGGTWPERRACTLPYYRPTCSPGSSAESAGAPGFSPSNRLTAKHAVSFPTSFRFRFVHLSPCDLPSNQTRKLLFQFSNPLTYNLLVTPSQYTLESSLPLYFHWGFFLHTSTPLAKIRWTSVMRAFIVLFV